MTIIKSFNTSRIVKHRMLIYTTFLVFMLLSTMPLADTYRSKIFLDPNLKLDAAVTLSIEELEQQLGNKSMNNITFNIDGETDESENSESTE